MTADRVSGSVTARIAGGIGITGAVAALTGAGLALFTWRTARRVEAAIPPAGKFINVDGTPVHYTDEGSGPAIVLIHGMGGQLKNFSSDALKSLSQDYRVVAMDRPGSGYSRRARGASAALGTHAMAVAGLIRELGLHRPLLVGHSLGGAVALAVALNHPDRVGGLALIAPLTNRQETVPPLFRALAIRSPVLRFLAAWTLATPASILNRDKALETLFGARPPPADFALKNGALLNLRPSSFYSASSDMAAVNEDLPGLIERYREITIPVGILYGTDDRVLDYRIHGEAMADKIPDLDLELIDGGDHMLPISAPGRTAAFIRRIAERIA